MQKRFLAPWFIRRVIYAVTSLVLVVLAGFGLIGESQIDSLTAQVGAVVAPLLGLVSSMLALGNTHAGSDSTVTVADVQAGGVDAAVVAAQVVEQITAYGKHAAPVADELGVYVEQLRSGVRHAD